MTKAHGPHGSAPARGTTTRDIHISQQGQSEAPAPTNPGEQTRIAVWRPIPGRYTIKAEAPPSAAQLEVLEELKEYTEKHLALQPDDEEYVEYAKWEKRFLDAPDTYTRYCRASKWKLDEAKRRLRETLLWRREYRPDLIKPSEIVKEAEGGKVVVNGFDTSGFPIIWLRPSRENTKPSPLQIRHLIFQIERAVDIMPEGVTKLALVVDYHGATAANNPSKDTAKQVIHILQNHYCERLGRAVVMNVPWYIDAFFKVLRPMLDPTTSSKIKFNPEMSTLVPVQQLDAEFGGQHDYLYDSRVYLPALLHYCGIKEDGTRQEVIPCKQKDAKPEEIQRALTMKHDDLERMAGEIDSESKAQQAGSHTPISDGPALAADHQSHPGHSPSATRSSHHHGLAHHSPKSTKHEGRSIAAGAAMAGATGAAIASSSSAPGDHQTVVDKQRSTPVEKPSAPIAEQEKDKEASVSHPPAADHTASVPVTAPPTRSNSKRGGWKLFSSKRGLDKEGKPTAHKHKHVLKGMCMHKGAIDPSKLGAASADTPQTLSDGVLPAIEIDSSSRTAAHDDQLAAEPSKNKIRIADSANASKDTAPQGFASLAPMPTNTTLGGPEDYQTAMEALETAGLTDYFSGVGDLKHRAIPVNHVAEQGGDDDAHIVRRETELMQRLKTDQSENLTLAFQVKKRPHGDAEKEGPSSKLPEMEETVLTAPYDADSRPNGV